MTLIICTGILACLVCCHSTTFSFFILGPFLFQTGDCDDDDDCDVGLVCFQRSRGDAVPGCDEGESETSQTDFCVPEGATLPPTTLGPTTLPPTRRPTVRSTDDDINGRDDELSSAPTFSPTISPTKSNEGSFIGDAMCNTLGLFC